MSTAVCLWLNYTAIYLALCVNSFTGKLISRLTVRCPPSSEAFVLRSNEFVAKLQNTGRREEHDTLIEEVTEDKVEDEEVELSATNWCQY